MKNYFKGLELLLCQNAVTGGISTEKIINRWLIVTFIAAAAFVIPALVFRGESLGTAIHGDEEFPLCEYISIDLLKTDVTIIPTQSDKIRFVWQNDVPLTAKTGDNSLEITESGEFVISLMADSSDYGMTLYLPQEYYRDILIYTVSGDVRLGAVDSDKINVVTNSGNILSENTRSMCSLVSSTGDITLDFYRVIPGSGVQSRKGNAEIIFPKGSSVALDFETESGMVETTLIGGHYPGSYLYSFNGGGNLIHAALETGTLKLTEK